MTRYEAITLALAVGNVVWPIVAYRLGRDHERKDRRDAWAREHAIREKDERERRINEVVNKYGQVSNEHQSAYGAHAMVRAGVKELSSDNEVREAVSRIERRWQPPPDKHPLGREAAQLKELDFFYSSRNWI
jgi:hypothetical protein